MSYARTAVTRMTLDMSRPDLQRSETVTLGDTNRRWEVTLINGGAPFRLPPNWTAALTGIKPDGTGLLNGCSVVDGKIIYDFAAGKEIATCAGNYPVQFDIWDEVGDLVASPKLYVNVLNDVRPNAELVSEGQYTLIGDAIKKITDMEEDVDLLAENVLSNGNEITAMKEKVTTAGTVTIPVEEWSGAGPHEALVRLGDNPISKGCVVLLVPEDNATKEAAGAARMSVYNVLDSENSYGDFVMVVRAESGIIPTIPLHFRFVVLKTDTEDQAIAAMVVDAYGEGGGSGVDEDAVKKIINSVLGNVANERQYSAANPPPYPVTSVNSKTGAVELTASDVKADDAGTAKSLTDTLAADIAKDLKNYYSKTQTYSRTEIDSKVSAIPKFVVKVVTSLPTSGISETTVYLVPDTTEGGGMYTEYIRVNGAWEELGSQKLDLSGYVTDDELEEAINAALTTAKESGEFDGATPKYGVDYWTSEDKENIKNDCERYIDTELAKRGQTAPIWAESAEDLAQNGDTTKLYLLPDGNIWSYRKIVTPPQPIFTNLANPDNIWAEGTNEDGWRHGVYHDSSGGYTEDGDGAFTTNAFACGIGQKVRIKGKFKDGNFSNHWIYLKYIPYKASPTTAENIYNAIGGIYLLQPPSVFPNVGVANTDVCSIVDDENDPDVKTITYEVLKSATGGQLGTAANVKYGKIAGYCTGDIDDIIITVDEEITYTEPVESYQWASTGIPYVAGDNEERVQALEARMTEVEEDVANIQKNGIGKSVFFGKTATFYGDSLTEQNYHYTKGFHEWADELLKLSSYRNRGVSGYTIADVYNRVQAEAASDTSDLIVVMAGVNDQGGDVPLGTITDSTTDTIYGSLNLLCAALATHYPDRIVVYITPAYQDKYPHAEGVTSWEVRKAIQEVCEKNSIAVYDNYVLSGIRASNLDIWTTDRCHWNNSAHEMVGRNLAKYLADTFRYLLP